MTEIISIFAEIPKNNKHQERLEQIRESLNDLNAFLKHSNINFENENECSYILLEPSLFCREGLTDLGLSGILKVSFISYVLNFSLQIIDENGNYIRARSQHQRTAVCRYMNTLNGKSKGLTMSCSPLSGEIKICLSFFCFRSENIKDIFLDVLNILEENREKITNIFEFLEYVPISMNKFLESIAEKMEKCRTVVLGTHQEYKESKQYEVYEECMLEPLPEKEIKYSWQDGTTIRILLEDLVKKIQGKLLLNSLQSKKTNWAFINIKEAEGKNKKSLEKLEDMKGIMNNGGSLQHTDYEQFTDSYFLNQANKPTYDTLKLDFIYKGSRRCEEETRTIEKVSKLHYYKFLREYVSIKNYEFLNKNYLIRKHEEFIKLRNYLLQNKLSLSFLTRLQLCYELISIGFIAMDSMKKFIPSYESYDINLSSDYSIKIETVASSYRNSVVSVQIAETCYEILYNLRCSSHGLKEVDDEMKIMKWYHPVKTIDDGEAKFQGISVMTYWLKKILTDVINNESYQEKNINIHRKTDLKNFKTTTRMNLILAPEYTSFSETFELDKEEPDKIDRNEGREKLELEKMLFVISLTYKCYKEIFEEKEPIFDIEI